jgi:5-hydroxyisourate hydrolase
MPGRLTTHVLDTSAGRPAEGVAVTLLRIGDGAVLHVARTNADGRLDQPLLDGANFAPGTYELRFEVGAYFRSRGIELGQPAFLDVVPIRFGVAAPMHYHVPLLVSPYGYSTYRGS